jgi:hypothetical protein
LSERVCARYFARIIESGTFFFKVIHYILLFKNCSPENYCNEERVETEKLKETEKGSFINA